MTPEERIEFNELKRKVSENPFSGEVNNLSRRKVPFVYGGAVAADGSAVKLPDGWTSSLPGSTGRFTVTHNLGHTNYSVVANANVTAFSASRVTLADISDKSANSFEVNLYDCIVSGSNAEVNQPFLFVLVTIPVV